MPKRKYSILWIVTIGEGLKHEYEFIRHTDAFFDSQEGLNWAKERIHVEIREGRVPHAFEILWIVTLLENERELKRKTVRYTCKFSNAEEALAYAKERIYIEVQECDTQGEVIPLMDLERGIDLSPDWCYGSPFKT